MKPDVKQSIISESYQFAYRLMKNKLTEEDKDNLADKLALTKLFIQKDIKEMSEEDRKSLEQLRLAEQLVNHDNPKQVISSVQRYIKEHSVNAKRRSRKR